MTQEVRDSKALRPRMDEVDKAQQEAIELLSDRVDTLIWVLCVLSILVVSSVIILSFGQAQ